MPLGPTCRCASSRARHDLGVSSPSGVQSLGGTPKTLDGLPSGNDCYIAIEEMAPVEIVDLSLIV